MYLKILCILKKYVLKTIQILDMRITGIQFSICYSSLEGALLSKEITLAVVEEDYGSKSNSEQ